MWMWRHLQGIDVLSSLQSCSGQTKIHKRIRAGHDARGQGCDAEHAIPEAIVIVCELSVAS